MTHCKAGVISPAANWEASSDTHVSGLQTQRAVSTTTPKQMRVVREEREREPTLINYIMEGQKPTPTSLCT